MCSRRYAARRVHSSIDVKCGAANYDAPSDALAFERTLALFGKAG